MNETSRVWRVVRYFDPGRDGFLARMFRLAAAIAVVGACGLAAVGAVALQTDAGKLVAVVTLTGLRMHERALPLAEDLTSDNPDATWQQYRFEAMILRRMGRTEECLAVYDEAVERFPDEWWAHGHRCFYGALLNDPNRVMDSCDRQFELNPDEPVVAYDRRGIARGLAGDLEGAEDDLRIALDLWREYGREGRWRVRSRSRWLETLEAGDDPFTPEMVERELARYD